MKTAAILNPAITSGSGSSTKPGAPSDTPFNKVLSEAEQRSKVNGKSGSGAEENRSATRAPQTAETAAKPNKSRSADDKAASIDETQSPSSTPTDTNSVDSTATEDVALEDDTAALAAASDELLALVANLAQTGVMPKASTAEAQPTGGDATAVAVSNVSSLADKGSDIAGDALSPELLPNVPTTEMPPTDKAGLVDNSQTQTGRDVKQAAIDTADTGIKTPGQNQHLVAQEVDGAAQAKNSRATEDGSKILPAVNAKTASTGEASAAPELGTAQNSAAQTGSAVSQLPADGHAAKPQDLPTTAPLTGITTQAQAVPQQMQPLASQAVTDRLAPRVGSQGWDNALGQKVVWMVAGEQQSASLTLNPPDLGPLQVVLSVSNNQATANFTAAQPEVRQALESAMPKLREMLGDAGIQLGQANVSAGTPGNQQNGFGERQPSSARSDQDEDPAIDMPTRVNSTREVTGGQGLVDTFA